MLVIGERINATRDRVATALNERDESYIAKEVQIQEETGADFIDVNAGSDPSEEEANLQWAIKVVQDNTDLPLCIDSSTAELFEEALGLIEGDRVMMNSITAEEDKMESLLPLAAEHNADLVALTMGDGGMPETAEERVELTRTMVEAAEEHGVGEDKLYIDPCVQPVSTSPEQGPAVVEAVRKITDEFDEIHTTCGLSNVSFGLPYRNVLNRVYLAYLIEAGLDSAILDPSEHDINATILAAEALCGQDDYCMNYVQAAREGDLQPE